MKSIKNNHDCNELGCSNKTRHYFLLLVLIALFVNLMLPVSSHAAGVSSGKMSVEFLYSIEYASGRSEKLQSPQDIFFDRGKKEFYVLEAIQHKLLIYDNNGMFIQGIRLAGSPGMIAVDGAGDLYVGFSLNPKITRLDYQGNFISDLYIPGTVDAPANRDSVYPMRLTTGPDGGVYTLKNTGGVVKIDPSGEAHEEISISGDGQPNAIVGMGMDSAGRLLFTDMRPYSAVIFDPRKKIFQRIGASGVLYGQIARPTGIAGDDAGHIFMLSGNLGKVLCYDRDGNFIEEFGGFGEQYGKFYMPSKIASDGKDRLFVLEDMLKRVQVFKIKFLNEEK